MGGRLPGAVNRAGATSSQLRRFAEKGLSTLVMSRRYWLYPQRFHLHTSDSLLWL